MIRKSLALLLFSFVLCVASEAQTQVPPPPQAPGAGADVKTFSMFFDGDSSYLGVTTEEVTKANFAKYGLPSVRGVAIQKVQEGSPAEKAGLLSGDVIVRFNGEEVTSVRKLTRLLGETSPDHEAKITVVRSGAEREVVATLGKRPMPKFEEGSFGTLPRLERFPMPPSGDFPNLPRPEGLPRIEGFPQVPDQPMVWRGSGRRIGVGVTALTKQLSEHFGVAGGVMVNEVRSDSPAAKAGLKAGDIIIEADGKEVKSDADLIRAIAEKKEGDVNLTIVRDRNRQTITVTPEQVKEGFNTFFITPMPPESPSLSSPIGFPSLMRSPFPILNLPGCNL